MSYSHVPSTSSQITLSIQIRLGGFSFSIQHHATEVSSGVVDGFDFSMLDPLRWGAGGYDRVWVWCDTPWATVVPLEVYRPEATERYLEALNLLGSDRQAMAVQQGVAVVVWAIERAVVDAFLAAIPTQAIEWNHPLAWLLARSQGQSIWIWTDDPVAHVVVADTQGVVAARSFVASVTDDLLYTLVQMSRRYDPTRQFGVVVAGRVDGALEATLRSVYAHVATTNDLLALVRSL